MSLKDKFARGVSKVKNVDLEVKNSFLGGLKGQLYQNSLKDVAKGRLKSPADLGAISNRLTPALRKNVLTGSVLRTLKVTDEELKEVYRDVLHQLGIEIKGETNASSI